MSTSPEWDFFVELTLRAPCPICEAPVGQVCPQATLHVERIDASKALISEADYAELGRRALAAGWPRP